MPILKSSKRLVFTAYSRRFWRWLRWTAPGVRMSLPAVFAGLRRDCFVLTLRYAVLRAPAMTARRLWRGGRRSCPCGPSRPGRARRPRAFGEEGFLLFGGELEDAAAVVLAGEGGEDAAVEAEVGVAHVGALDGSGELRGRGDERVRWSVWRGYTVAGRARDYSLETSFLFPRASFPRRRG